MKNWFKYTAGTTVAISLVGILSLMLLFYGYMINNSCEIPHETFENVINIPDEISINVLNDKRSDATSDEKTNDNDKSSSGDLSVEKGIEITDPWSNEIPSQEIFDLHFGGNELYDTQSFQIESAKDIENVLNQGGINWSVAYNKYNKAEYELGDDCELHIWFYHYNKHYNYSTRYLPKGSLLSVPTNGYITYDTGEWYANVADIQNIRISITIVDDSY